MRNNVMKCVFPYVFSYECISNGETLTPTFTCNCSLSGAKDERLDSGLAARQRRRPLEARVSFGLP